jgi:hypothetical protein
MAHVAELNNQNASRQLSRLTPVDQPVSYPNLGPASFAMRNPIAFTHTVNEQSRACSGPFLLRDRRFLQALNSRPNSNGFFMTTAF